jgi:AraC family transcriptional regulator of arabinose operon
MERRLRVTPHPRVSDLTTGHFRENAGYYSWRPDGTNDWLLVYTIDGGGYFGDAAGGRFSSTPGELVLIRPETLHDYGTEPGAGRWELIWSHFHPRPHWHDWLGWPEVAPGVMRLALSDTPMRQRIVERFFDAHRLATGPHRRRAALAMNALEEVLLWCDTQNPRSTESKLDPRVLDAMNFICRSLDRKVTLDDVADAGGLSASRLSRLFKDQVGHTPQQFLELQRLTRAMQLMETTPLSIKEVAQRVGFDNPFYFTLRFKRHTGRSPKQWKGGGASPKPETRMNDE